VAPAPSGSEKAGLPAVNSDGSQTASAPNACLRALPLLHKLK
jgi:hypothetical protein